jgi:glutamate racemase
MSSPDATAAPADLAAPIAVFDSGVGGLSVLRAIRDRLPNEPLLYVADSGNAPYGDRDIEFILGRSMAIASWMVQRGAKEIVVACNTATVVSVQTLRAAFTVPIVALEPAIKPAAEGSRSHVIGVLATSRTLESPAVERLQREYGGNTRIVLQPCPGLVEQVERGLIDSDETTALLQSYLESSLRAGADHLVLGCTHYAFLRDRIQALVGPDVTLVDSGDAVARQTERRLPFAAPPGSAREEFFTTGDLVEARAHIPALWGAPVRVQSL